MTRLDKVRSWMGKRGYEAVVVRANSDLRWILGVARVMDDEVAHTALITADAAWLHTDSRYFGAFVERLGEESPWTVDAEPTGHAAWLAKRLVDAQARVVAVEDTLTLGFFESLKHELNVRSGAALMPRLHGDLSLLRLVKDEDEILEMKRAQAVTDAAFTYISDFIEVGMSELEIRAELEGYMLSHGGDALSFGSIIASGPNGANPHARPSARRVREGDMIVMDYGAALNDYHSDMTRTVCVGKPSDLQRKVYDIVRKAHEECARVAHPGIGGKKLHMVAVKVIEEAGYGSFFNHGLGHGVGVEIHERPHVGIKSTDTIPVGAVFTIEPGIYLPGEFGVRLEDFGVMREGGYEPFTASTHDLVCVG